MIGGEGAGLGPLLAVVVRYLQLPARDIKAMEDDPTEFVAEDDDDCPPPSTARSAGLALIRDLCQAFPEKVTE